MENRGQRGTPPIVAVPPTRPGLLGPGKPATWPTAIGVIAIVFGMLGSLSGLWGTVAPLFMPVWADLAVLAGTNAPPGSAGPRPNTAAMFGAMAASATSMALASAVAMVVAVVLLVAGIGLVQQRPWGVRMVKLWAWARILTAVWVIGVSVIVQRDQMAAMAQGPGAPPGMPATVLMGVAAGMAALGLLWAWALPVFVLVWFRGPAVKAEVARWR